MGPTVLELFQRWSAARMTLASIVTDRGRFERLAPVFGGVLASDVTAGAVDDYRAARAQQVTRRGRAPTVATVNREVSLLLRLLNFGVSRDLLPINPIRGKVRLEPENNVREVVVDEEGIEAILWHIDHYPAYAWAILAFESGMRRGELRRLCWRQLDFEAGAIAIPAAHTKSKRPRVVEFPGRSQAAIRDLEEMPGCAEVFTNSATSKPYNPRWLYELFVRAVIASEVVGLDGRRPTWHDLRRSYVTLMRKRGVQETVVMKFSGHSSRAVFERYNVVSPEEMKPAMLLNAQGRAKELFELRTKRRSAKVAPRLDVKAKRQVTFS